MPLITFSIHKDMNIIIQFPIFVQPCTQKPLILYQLETVPIPIVMGVTTPSVRVAHALGLQWWIEHKTL